MLLSPSSPSPAATMDIDSARVPGGSQFTMFLTAPLQAFCYLLGYSGSNVNMVSLLRACITIYILFSMLSI